MTDPRIARASAIAGGAVWVLLAIAYAADKTPFGLIELYFLLAPLCTVPLGLALVARLRRPSHAGAEVAMLRLQPVAALFVVASFWFSPGAVATVLATPWLAVCGLTALAGFARLVRDRSLSPEIGFEIGPVYLAVGGGWLIASRLGVYPFGFGEPITLLTGVHFHYSGFAACILAALAARAVAVNDVRWHRAVTFAAYGIYGTSILIAAGFSFSPTLQVFAVHLFAVCFATLAIVTLGPVSSGQSRAMARWLLRTSALAILAGMALAVVYAWGEYRDDFVLSIGQMARLHGPLNGIGFVLSALVAWTVSATR